MQGEKTREGFIKQKGIQKSSPIGNCAGLSGHREGRGMPGAALDHSPETRRDADLPNQRKCTGMQMLGC